MTVLDAASERQKLRRGLGRLDTVFFLISAMVVADTIGAIAVGGGQAFTWLVVLLPPSISANAPTVCPSQQYLRLSRNYYQFKSQEEVNAWNALFLPITQGS